MVSAVVVEVVVVVVVVVIGMRWMPQDVERLTMVDSFAGGFVPGCFDVL